MISDTGVQPVRFHVSLHIGHYMPADRLAPIKYATAYAVLCVPLTYTLRSGRRVNVPVAVAGSDVICDADLWTELSRRISGRDVSDDVILLRVRSVSESLSYSARRQHAQQPRISDGQRHKSMSIQT